MSLRYSTVEEWVAIEAWAALEEKEKDRKGLLRLSGIGRCSRRLWAEHHGKVEPEKIEGRILDLFRLGHRIEAHVVELLRGAGFEMVYTGDNQEEVLLYFDAHIVTGHPDGRILIDGEWCILEIKSANENQFRRCREEGVKEWKPEYYDQAQAYMGCTGLDAALFIVYSKNDSAWHVEKVRFNSARFGQLREKANVVVNAKKPPPKLESSIRNNHTCRFCHGYEWCNGPIADVTFAE